MFSKKELQSKLPGGLYSQLEPTLNEIEDKDNNRLANKLIRRLYEKGVDQAKLIIWVNDFYDSLIILDKNE